MIHSGVCRRDRSRRPMRASACGWPDARRRPATMHSIADTVPENLRVSILVEFPQFGTYGLRGGAIPRALDNGVAQVAGSRLPPLSLLPLYVLAHAHQSMTSWCALGFTAGPHDGANSRTEMPYLC